VPVNPKSIISFRMNTKNLLLLIVVMLMVAQTLCKSDVSHGKEIVIQTISGEETTEDSEATEATED
jgi:hypothetical protein